MSSFPLNAGLFAVAAVLLGGAVERRLGFYDEGALVLLTLALVVTAIGVIGLQSHSRVIGRVALERLLIAGIALQLILLLIEQPGAHLQIADRTALLPFRLGVVAVACILLAGRGVSALGHIWFPALLCVHFALGLWVVQLSPHPPIDVITVHREAIAALASGQNPYAITFANIYPADTEFYAPGMVVDQRVRFGLPYPPLSLLLVAPGELLFGDYRYASLAALSLTGAAIGYSAPAAVARLAATLFLFTPRVFFVLEQGWTEPVVVLLLAVTVFCTLNAERWTLLALGGLVVVKQYLVFAVPLSLLLIPRPWWPRSMSLLWRVAAVGVAITVPFIVWDPPAFSRSVVMLQIYEPFRPDSLSYLSFLDRYLGAPPPIWVSVVPVVLTLGLVLWKGRHTPSGFAAGLALMTFVIFAFGKKAFCNYYFFVIGALCCASAALTHDRDAKDKATPQSPRFPL